MTEQTEQRQFADVVARIERAAAEIKITGPDLEGLPIQLTELITQSGFQASTGTIAFAGQYASGGYAVQYNDQNGGFSSSWPLWASNSPRQPYSATRASGSRPTGTRFGANLVFVMILP